MEFVGSTVSGGAAKSRADFIWHPIRREQRRLVAERDAAISADLGEDLELDGLADYAARLPRPERD